MNNGTCLRQGYMRLLVVFWGVASFETLLHTLWLCMCSCLLEAHSQVGLGSSKGGLNLAMPQPGGPSDSEGRSGGRAPGPTTRRHRVGEDCGWRVSVLDITRSVAGRCGRAGSRPRAPNLPWPSVRHTLAQEKTKRTIRGKGGSPECPWA